MPPQDQPSLANLVDNLFQTIRHRDGREYSHTEVAEAVARRTRGELTIDASSIGKLRAGHVKNPSIKLIEALALFFGVDTDYFFPKLARLRQEESRKARGTELQVALRSIGLDPTMREHLSAIINALAPQDKGQDLEDHGG